MHGYSTSAYVTIQTTKSLNLSIGSLPHLHGNILAVWKLNKGLIYTSHVLIKLTL
jgi:hypothetical protein